MTRYENKCADSSILAIVTYTGNCSYLGPWFHVHTGVKNLSSSLYEFSRDQLAIFLNDATGKTGKKPSISIELAEAVFESFKDVLAKNDDGVFSYTGPRSVKQLGSVKDFFESYEMGSKEMSEDEEPLSLMQPSTSKIPSNAKAVIQHQIGFTDDNFSVVGTYGAGPCVILAAYNKASQQAFVAHIDGLTTLQSLNSYFLKLSELGTQKLQIFLSGGDSSSKKEVKDIIKMVKGIPYLDIVYSDLMTSNYDSKSFAINAKTGEFYTDVRPTQLIHYKGFKDDMMSLALLTRPTAIKLTPKLTTDSGSFSTLGTAEAPASAGMPHLATKAVGGRSPDLDHEEKEEDPEDRNPDTSPAAHQQEAELLSSAHNIDLAGSYQDYNDYLVASFVFEFNLTFCYGNLT